MQARRHAKLYLIRSREQVDGAGWERDAGQAVRGRHGHHLCTGQTLIPRVQYGMVLLGHEWDQKIGRGAWGAVKGGLNGGRGGGVGFIYPQSETIGDHTLAAERGLNAKLSRCRCGIVPQTRRAHRHTTQRVPQPAARTLNMSMSSIFREPLGGTTSTQLLCWGASTGALTTL